MNQLISAVMLSLVLAPPSLGDQGLDIVLEERIRLPRFAIDGLPARIHTQGLYVTPRHFYVTGRLETVPKRAVLVRFARDGHGQVDGHSQVEWVDITPGRESVQSRYRLDHPGGFDSDGDTLWIPVSASQPHSATVVVRFELTAKPLNKTAALPVFEVQDHIGALAFDCGNDRLYGANWDTKALYVWQSSGKLIEKIEQSALVPDASTGTLAVQDWKVVAPGIVLAAGIDKTSRQPPGGSRAVVQLLHPAARKRLAMTRLPRPQGCRSEVTREGMAVVGDRLFLLPADLGDDATIYCYRWRHAKK